MARITPGAKVALLYALPSVWHGIWIASVLSGKGSFSNLNRFWGVLFFVIPILWFYALVRVAIGERTFVGRHPLLFLGAVGVAMLPPIVFLLVIFIIRAAL